ncbi:MAG: TIGR01777 family oxidoreductase [Candidatus Promineifilaceae bacterium]
MRIIITGGTGLIGRPLSTKLAAAGYEVIILSRNPDKHDLPKEIQAVKWDGKTAENWGHLADGAKAIFNLAGENISGSGFIPSRWTPERKERIRQSRLMAGQAVTQAVAQATRKPEVVLQASGIDYYPAGDDLQTEDSPPGDSFLAEVVTRYWEPATAEVEKIGVRRVIMRTGIVLAKEGGALPITVLPFKLFAGGPLGAGTQWWSWIHIVDVVRAMQFLMENEAATGPVNLVSPHPLTNKAFAVTIGQVLNRPAFVSAPAFALKLGLGEISTIVLDGRRVSCQKLLDLGFTFLFPDARSALADLLG